MKLNWRKEMEKICEEIEKLEPTYSEISEYSEDADPYGELTFCRRDDNPLVIRFHDTWRKKWQGRLHIDIISGEFHLMLDKNNAPRFLDFIKNKRKKK